MSITMSMNHIQESQALIQKNYMSHTPSCNLDYMKDQLLSLIMEATEAMDELPWKRWKKNQSFNRSEFIGELVDVQLFLFNLVNEVGVAHDQFITLCRTKQMHNIHRQTNGY